jgi:mannosyl-oligosaccharide alpha-1,3-glucosidase
MRKDPFTLTIALDKSGSAKGDLYLDDGETYQHEKGEIVWRGFQATKSGRKGLKISSVDLAQQQPNAAVDNVALANVYQDRNPYAESISEVKVERIVVLGLEAKPKKVKIEGVERNDWVFEAATGSKAAVLTIKNPGVKIVKSWDISVEA